MQYRRQPSVRRLSSSLEAKLRAIVPSGEMGYLKTYFQFQSTAACTIRQLLASKVWSNTTTMRDQE